MSFLLGGRDFSRDGLFNSCKGVHASALGSVAIVGRLRTFEGGVLLCLLLLCGAMLP